MSTSKPRILFVIARLNIGGTSQYISEVVKGLQNKGYDIVIATGFVQAAELEDSRVKDLPILRIKSLGRKISPVKDLRSWIYLRKIVKDFKPDVIYSHTFKAGLIARTMPTSVPRIHAFHGHLLSEPELGGWKRKLVIAIERLLASRAQKIVTVGQKVAFELLQERVGREEQYLSIPPGVIPVDLESRNEALNELGIKDGRPIVAWFARLALVKAPDRAIELARRLPEVQVVVAGGGELLDELRTQRMENLHVVGWQPASRIWSVADIAISTSKNEGMPVALIEAQLAGIPVVGLDVGSVGEVIEDEVTGYVLSHFDDKFIEKVNLLAQDKSLRLKMGEAARKRASILFSPKQLVDSHNTLFQKLLS